MEHIGLRPITHQFFLYYNNTLYVDRHLKLAQYSSGRSIVLPMGEMSASTAFALGVYWDNPALCVNKIFRMGQIEPHVSTDHKN